MSAARTLFTRSLVAEDSEAAPGLGAFLMRDEPLSQTATPEEEAASRPEFLKFILGMTGLDTALDIVGKFTSTAPQQAAQKQLMQSQQMQVERDAFVAQQRSETVQTVGPWIALGMGVLVVTVVLGVAAARKKAP